MSSSAQSLLFFEAERLREEKPIPPGIIREIFRVVPVCAHTPRCIVFLSLGSQMWTVLCFG